MTPETHPERFGTFFDTANPKLKSSDYYGITAAMRDGAPDYAAAQRILIGMVESGLASWWPGMALIAVNRGQLNLGVKSDGI